MSNSTQTRYTAIKISVLPTTSISSKDNQMPTTISQKGNDRVWLPPLLDALTGLILITMVTSLFYCRHRRRRHTTQQPDNWSHPITQPPPAYSSMREKSPAYSSMREKSSSEPFRLQYSPQLAFSPSFTDLSEFKETSSPAVVCKIEQYDPKVNLPLDHLFCK
ncbi:hypothetical protein A0J61_06298 [Choanephora cucurbitarum]|uniref:Uncharacterized protein n=1 Tax=Choanephora cucurbitarum TaxID=101091 RepID=A0A1C7N945_9FUNG|nr:hypothetical protein A0J61_06298 [Choanephora cucurbitarum]